MHKIVYCLFLTALLSTYGFSQKKLDPSEAEKETAKNLKEIYPDDDVAILQSTDYVSFGFNKKDGIVTVNHDIQESMISIDSRADIQKYCFYDGQTEIKKFDIKLKNNKKAGQFLKDEAYTSDDLFHNDARVKYTNLSFPLLGFKYNTEITKAYKDIKYFTKIYFNDTYPIVKKNIEIEIPNWLNLELKEFNFDGYNIKKNVTTNSKNNSKIYSFTIEDISAFDKEEDAPGPTYIYPHILILPKSHTFNGKQENIFNSTQDLYNWYKSLVNSLENDNSSFQDKVKLLIADTKNDKEKIKNIYYWVQDNIRYIAFEDGIAGFKPDEASSVFNKKYGDCKGMANLTKQMLIEAGFDARLTWIGTKRIAYDYSTPNLSVDNHMICSLMLDGQPVFLDGTEKFNAYGEYANRIQGKQVLIEDGDKFILKTVPEINSEFNKEVHHYTFTINNDVLEGNATQSFNGESRSSLLYNFDILQNDKKDEFLDYYLNNGSNNIKVLNIETSDLSNRDLNLKISYDINVKNAVSSFDNDVYIDIDFNKELDNFNLDKRKTDYAFSFKRLLESTTTLNIPAGYSISSIPENIKVTNKNFDASIHFSKEKNSIIYKKVFNIKNAKIEVSDFEAWNDFISKLKKNI